MTFDEDQAGEYQPLQQGIQAIVQSTTSCIEIVHFLVHCRIMEYLWSNTTVHQCYHIVGIALTAKWLNHTLSPVLGCVSTAGALFLMDK